MAVGAEHGEVRDRRRAAPTTSAVAEVYTKAGAQGLRHRRRTLLQSGRRSRARPRGRTTPARTKLRDAAAQKLLALADAGPNRQPGRRACRRAPRWRARSTASSSCPRHARAAGRGRWCSPSSVVSRYFLHASTDWQDEAAVFCLVGATFLCGAFVQAQRGHVGIEAAVGGAAAARQSRAHRSRRSDRCSFCTLLRVEVVDAAPRGLGRRARRPSSTWAPPLWIPYGLMAVGMTLLTLQLVVQLLVQLSVQPVRPWSSPWSSRCAVARAASRGAPARMSMLAAGGCCSASSRCS